LTKVQEIRNARLEKIRQVDEQFKNLKPLFFQRIEPFFDLVMREFNATVILEKRSVLRSIEGIDITDLLVERVDDAFLARSLPPSRPLKIKPRFAPWLGTVRQNGCSGKCCTARQGLVPLLKLRIKYMTELASADIQLIQAILPHRYPFLLVDRVEDIDGVKSARGIKNVTMNEPHFQGIFQARPLCRG